LGGKHNDLFESVSFKLRGFDQPVEGCARLLC